MADGGLYTKPQRLVSSKTDQNKKNPSKFYSHFLFKALIVTIFLIIIPLFPSEAPEFVSPSIFSRGWELFQLVFVGIVVSYGLFSRKNDDSETENNSKFDSTQSYVSRLLQVPSVFDDEVDSPSGSDDNNINQVKTWSSQYYRNQPMLVVAKENSVIDKNSRVGEKPLLLPVRSLKSRISDGSDVDLVNGDDSGISRVYARSNSSPSGKGFLNNSKRMGRIDVGFVTGEDDGVSRAYTRSNSSPSGKGFSYDSKRMSRNGSVKSQSATHKEFGLVNGDGEISRSLSRSNSNLRKHSSGDYGDLDEEDMDEHAEEVEESIVLPSPIPWRSRSGRMEVKGESNDLTSQLLPPSLEESGAARLLKSQSSRSFGSKSSYSSPKELSSSPSMASPKKLSPSPSLSSESLAKSVEDFGRRKAGNISRLPPPPPPPPPPRSRLVSSSSSKDNEEMSNFHKDLKQSVLSEPKDMGRGNREEYLNRTNARLEAKARNAVDSSSIGRSVRTVRAAATRTQDIEEEELGGVAERRSKEVESTVIEKPERRSAGYNSMPKASFSEHPKETRDFLEQILVGTDDESESEDDNYIVERVENERVENMKVEETPSESVDEGPDVNKKADKFIAKFREQIRLQRIESIKRSTGQLKRNSVR